MSTRVTKKTPAGLEYQTDLLSKEVKRLRKSLTSQVGALDELVQTADATTVKQEFERLSGTFAELSSVSNRLCALISKEDATQEENALTLDGEKLERIRKSIFNEEDNLSEVSQRSANATKKTRSLRNMSNNGTNRDGIEDQEMMGDGSMGKTLELMRRQSNLENQASLCDDLLKADDVGMLKREVEKLEQLYEDAREF